MKIFYLIYISVFLISLPVSAQDYFETLYDVPVMAGLIEIPDQAMSFDKADGRIAEAGALAENINPEDVSSFYDVALTQMGWQARQAGVYHRETERLRLKIISMKGGDLLVQFSLEPLK